MNFPFLKKPAGERAEIAALMRQLESARRRITELTLEAIQQADEIARLKDYRGVPEISRPVLAIGKEMSLPALAANSEIGRLSSAG